MVDFNKLRDKKNKPKPIEPIEIFRRLPKPFGINDLYTSQAEVLQSWFTRRNDHDVVIKLHTGGGKTLVGLLIAQSTLNETKEPVLYLTPNKQLLNQTLEKTKAIGINAVEYQSKEGFPKDFTNANAIMVATYAALFNGQSKFGLRGNPHPQIVSSIILDDAHVAFSVVRDSFTLEIQAKEDKEKYSYLTSLFRKYFDEIEKLGTFDDIVSGSESLILEVPYWGWHEQINAVHEYLKSNTQNHKFVWPLLRDRLQHCHALISRDSFTITPILPFIDCFPTFSEAARRVYMSATIADDSDLIRTFNANPELVKAPISSRSLAGISERMILIPSLMHFRFEETDTQSLLHLAAEKKRGAIVLVPSDNAALKWEDKAIIAKGSEQVQELITKIQNKDITEPVVFSNRYDGIDFHGDTCRLLIMSNLPSGTSNYELFRASTLYGGKLITQMLAQRIEQGIGRGARGAGDYCVVLLLGADLASWIAKNANFKFLTSATKAQLEMGTEISKSISDTEDLKTTIIKSFEREQDWVEYHAETLAEYVDEELFDASQFVYTNAERKAFSLWQDGYPDKAISVIEQCINKNELDKQIKGWLFQLAARIADKWGNYDRAKDLQRQAFSYNRNLIRSQILPPYRPISPPSDQAKAIVEQLGSYRQRKGFLEHLQDVSSYLNNASTANQFEEALSKLAFILGLYSERHDVNGEGPDVLWLLPQKIGIVIEAKSRKKERNALTKIEHGQLLVAEEWFKANYHEYKCIRASVHPQNKATKAAVAGASHAITYEKLAILVSDVRKLLLELCESQLPTAELTIECGRLLANSPLEASKLIENYFLPFENTD
ncbi:TPA: DEAD/DEAH box helicase family protein [Legionella pneumophila]|nr:DEAD/DEAH box helicase family protein [Legionella pneumophila]HDS3860540.1 DEAD/DEAH box helicase family protein [Legionella pneumophila]